MKGNQNGRFSVGDYTIDPDGLTVSGPPGTARYLMDYDRSIVVARRAVAVAPTGDSFSARWTLAFRLGFTLEGVDEALAIHAELEKVDVPIRPMVNEKANLYLLRGDVDAALAEAKAAVDGNSNPANPYIPLLVYANILATKGHVTEAQQVLMRVRGLLPKFNLKRAIWSFARSHRDQRGKDAVTQGLKLLASLEDDPAAFRPSN